MNTEQPPDPVAELEARARTIRERMFAPGATYPDKAVELADWHLIHAFDARRYARAAAVRGDDAEAARQLGIAREYTAAAEELIR